jgi:hypothetical protein
MHYATFGYASLWLMQGVIPRTFGYASLCGDER